MAQGDPAAALAACVVRVDVLQDGVPIRRGSAFFVAPGKALTCAHTFFDDAAQALPGVAAVFHQGARYAARVLPQQASLIALDLAVIEIEGVTTNQSVRVGPAENLRTNDAVYSFGFSSDHTTKAPIAESLTFKVQGRAERLAGAEAGARSVLYLGLKSDQVSPGNSGAPVMDLATGVVCGVLARTRNMANPAGGLAVPLTEEIISELKALGVLAASDTPAVPGAEDYVEARRLERLRRSPEAVALYRRAADAGHAEAMNTLGWLYEHGKAGLPRDDPKAWRLYTDAARYGSAQAQYNLGVMSERDSATAPANARAACEHFAAAAGLGHVAALAAYADCLERGCGGMARDDRQAFGLYLKAAEHGWAEAQFHVGRYCEQGRGGQARDRAAAIVWYGRSAAGGFRPAAERLTLLEP